MQKTATDIFQRLARQQGHLSARQIDRLRAEADSEGTPFDEHCRRSGALDEETVRVLRKQTRKIEKKRDLENTYRLGGIAVELGFLDERGVSRAVRRQRKLRKDARIDARLGELFLVRGDLSIEQLEEVLATQSKRLGRCEACDEVFRLAKPGRRARCPRCDERLARPEQADRTETIRRASKLQKKMLARFDRKQMVLDASDAVEKLQRRSPVNESGGHRDDDAPVERAKDLTVIDLDSGETTVERQAEEAPTGDAIGSARTAFSAFYEEMQDELQGAEPQAPSRRASGRTLDEVLASSRAVAAKETVEVRRFPIFLASALALLVSGALFLGWLYWKSENDRIAHREKLAQIQQTGQQTGQQQAPEAGSSLAPGARVRVVGVIRGGAGNLVRSRTGLVLVARGHGAIWVEDPKQTLRDLFAQLAERHGNQMRTALALEGELQPASSLDRTDVPADVKGPWLRYDPARLKIIAYSAMRDAGESIQRLEE